MGYAIAYYSKAQIYHECGATSNNLTSLDANLFGGKLEQPPEAAVQGAQLSP